MGFGFSVMLLVLPYRFNRAKTIDEFKAELIKSGEYQTQSEVIRGGALLAASLSRASGDHLTGMLNQHAYERSPQPVSYARGLAFHNDRACRREI
jgi:Arc/MetJ-type ribon-helix-helix transcriptional regulator